MEEVLFINSLREAANYVLLRIFSVNRGAESQKPRQRVSNADRKVFANPDSGKFLRQVHNWLKNFRILCSTKYPDNMQSVHMNWKVSGQSKKRLDNLENVSG